MEFERHKERAGDGTIYLRCPAGSADRPGPPLVVDMFKTACQWKPLTHSDVKTHLFAFTKNSGHRKPQASQNGRFRQFAYHKARARDGTFYLVADMFKAAVQRKPHTQSNIQHLFGVAYHVWPVFIHGTQTSTNRIAQSVRAFFNILVVIPDSVIKEISLPLNSKDTRCV